MTSCFFMVEMCRSRRRCYPRRSFLVFELKVVVSRASGQVADEKEKRQQKISFPPKECQGSRFPLKLPPVWMIGKNNGARNKQGSQVNIGVLHHVGRCAGRVVVCSFSPTAALAGVCRMPAWEPPSYHFDIILVGCHLVE